MSLPLWANLVLTGIAVAIAAGNGAIFMVFFINRKIRTITNHFVLSLAVSDFLVGTILVPLRTWSPESSALGPLIAFMLIASLSNITGCTYDRYVAIQKPLRYHAIITKHRVSRIIIAIWTIPLLIAVIPQLWLNTISHSHTLMAARVYIGFMSFGVLATCIVLSGIYIGVFRVAKRHFNAIAYLEDCLSQRRDEGSTHHSSRSRRSSLKSLVKDVKATKLVAMIAATFILCWLPLIIINIADSLGYQHVIPRDFVATALFTIFANSLVNPMIYAFFQKGFRTTISQHVHKFFRKKRNRYRKERSSETVMLKKISTTTSRAISENSLFELKVMTKKDDEIDQNQSAKDHEQMNGKTAENFLSIEAAKETVVKFKEDSLR